MVLPALLHLASASVADGPLVLPTDTRNLLNQAFSADGTTSVTLGRAGDLRVWRVPKGKWVEARLVDQFQLFKTPIGPNDPFPAISLSPRGDRIAYRPGEARSVQLYSLRPFRLLKSLLLPGKRHWGLVWHPNGRTMLFTLERSTYAMPLAGTKGRTLPIRDPYVFLPNGRRVVGFTEKGPLLADLVSGKIIWHTQSPDWREWLRAAASPDGRYLACYSHAGYSPDGEPTSEAGIVHEYRLWVWRLADGKLLHNREFEPVPTGVPWTLRFLPKGGGLIASAMGGVVDPATGKVVRRLKDETRPEGWWPLESEASRPLEWRFVRFPEPPLPGTFATFSPDGKTLLVGVAGAPTLLAWDLPTGLLRKRFSYASKGEVRELRYLRDGRLLVGGGKGIDLFSPDLKPLGNLRSPKYTDPMGTFHSETTLTPDGKLAVSSSGPFNGTRVWRVADGERVSDIRLALSPRGARFTPDGRVMIRGLAGHALAVVAWRLDTGEQIWEYRSPKDIGAWIELSPDGRWVAIATQQARPERYHLDLLDPKTGRLLRTVPTPPTLGLAVAPDSRSLALQTPHGIEVRRLDALDKPVRIPVPVSIMSGNRLAFSADGRRILMTGYEAPTRLYDIATRRPVATFSFFKGGDWTITTPGGAAKGSPGGLRRLHQKTSQGLRPLAKPLRPREVDKALAEESRD